jgi:hypothetical protein
VWSPDVLESFYFLPAGRQVVFYLEYYSSLTLNFFTLNPMKSTVMERSTSVSFQTYRKPVPLIIILLIIVIKYLGGNK